MAGEKDKPKVKPKYSTLPMNEYVEHTKQYDPQFGNFFPQDRAEELQQRNIDFRTKYGEYAANREWWGDIANQTVPSSNRRYSDVVMSVAKREGVDPKQLYGNATEEGFFKTLHGKDVAGAEGIPDKNYPINGMVALGLDEFGQDAAKLKQYLPENFDYKTVDRKNNKGEKVTSAFFKTPEDALTAMSAYMKSKGGEVDAAAKQKGIDLTPLAKEFFTAAAYNGGIKNVGAMMDYYKSKGQLKDDAFLTNNDLGGDKYGQIYENARRRMDAVNGLEKEGKLDFSEKRMAQSDQPYWTANFEGYLKSSKDGVKVIEPKDTKVPFDLVITKNGKKIIRKDQDISKVDVNTLPDLDEYDYDTNIQNLKTK